MDDPMSEQTPSKPEPTRALGKRGKQRWRPLLRSLHRDVGYLAVGLTFVYALSGIAVNHIGEWDPNFEQFERTHALAEPLPDDEELAVAQVLAQLDIDETPTSTFFYEQELEIQLEQRTISVDGNAGKILDRGQEARPFLRAANWLHLNRGKRAWTIVADGYAALLLFLAASGMFMLPGKKGLVGRGWILVLLGAAIPILYVVLSGGP
jgi:hypothetical protein